MHLLARFHSNLISILLQNDGGDLLDLFCLLCGASDSGDDGGDARGLEGRSSGRGESDKAIMWNA